MAHLKQNEIDALLDDLIDIDMDDAPIPIIQEPVKKQRKFVQTTSKPTKVVLNNKPRKDNNVISMCVDCNNEMKKITVYIESSDNKYGVYCTNCDYYVIQK
jgi:hypothetical protein